MPTHSAPPSSVPPFPPLTVEVTRGDLVECRHIVHAVVVNAAGQVQRAWGEVESPIYPRSAYKPLLALMLVETGAADRFGLSERELSLACASHNGEPAHVAAVTAWLARLGMDARNLECGVDLPIHEPSARALHRSGNAPEALHNNCSGKHTGFLTVARHLGLDPAGYIRREHPVQVRAQQVLEELMGLELSRVPHGVDGCGFPQFGVPLRALAWGMARLAAPETLGGIRSKAAARINRAIAAEPFYIAGTDRFCTDLARATQGRVLAKAGAEGVYSAWVPGQGLGVALKTADGAARARNPALAAVLRAQGLLSAAEFSVLAAHASPVLRNVAGREVGLLRVAGLGE